MPEAQLPVCIGDEKSQKNSIQKVLIMHQSDLIEEAQFEIGYVATVHATELIFFLIKKNKIFSSRMTK